MSDDPDIVISLTSVSKSFQRGDTVVRVLDSLNLTMQRGSFEALMGPSGSGKSTLLNLIAGLDRPTQGSVRVAGIEISKLSTGQLSRFRADHLGFVFQAYNLIPVLTALENVELPLQLTRLSRRERKERAETALNIVGLRDRMGFLPRELSGGQEQRVAIARAIVNDPELIVADEPTGDLDRKSSEEILHLLEKLSQEFGKTIIMVTHDARAALRARITHYLEKGQLVESAQGAPEPSLAASESPATGPS